MASHGGKRAGSGRKPRASKHKTAIARAEKKIVDRLPQLIDNLFKLADGFLAQKADAGGVDIYSTIPDRVANQYLIDRILGRPTERQDLTSDGQPLASSAVHIYLPANGRDDPGNPPEQPPATGVPGVSG